MTARPRVPAPRAAADGPSAAQLDRLAHMLGLGELSGLARLTLLGLRGYSASFSWTCPDCRLDSLPYQVAAEAEYLAGVHDDTHHGGNPTTYVTVTVKGPQP